MSGNTSWFVAVLPSSLALAGPIAEVRRRLPEAFALHGGIATEAQTGEPLGLVRVGSLNVWLDALDVWVVIAENERREALTAVRLPGNAAHFAQLSYDRRFLRLIAPCDFMALPPERLSFRGMRVHHHGARPRRAPKMPRARKVASASAGRPSRSGMLDRDGAAAAHFIAGTYAVRLSRYLADRIANTPGRERNAR